jgi:hypothetical protein
MLRRILLLFVDSAVFHADGVHEEREQRKGHLGLRDVRVGARGERGKRGWRGRLGRLGIGVALAASTANALDRRARFLEKRLSLQI